MGNAPSSKPGDLSSGYVGFEIRQAGDRGIFKKDPRKYSVQLENGALIYAVDYTDKHDNYIYLKQISLQKPLLANGYLNGAPVLEFVAELGWRSRDASIIAPSGKPVCQVRKESTFTFSYEGKDYRWQRKPVGNWLSGFPDRATMKLVEMHGQAWGPTVASLHSTFHPDHGRVATLYVPSAATANPKWQDLIVLVAVVAMQQEFNRRRRDGSGATGSASWAGAGASC